MKSIDSDKIKGKTKLSMLGSTKDTSLKNTKFINNYFKKQHKK